MSERPTKRRASFEDTMSAPVYTDAPKPPYTFAIQPMLWCTVTIDPLRVAPFLPKGLRLSPEGTAHFALFGLGMGWGLQNSSAAFPCVVIEDFPSPDTAEAAWIPVGLMDGPPADLMQRHYASFSQGQTRFEWQDDLLTVTVTSSDGPILTARARVDFTTTSSVSSIDRYLGHDQRGRLVSSLVSVTCDGAVPAGFLSLDIAPQAPPVWQAFTPIRLDWCGHVPLILANWSEPAPVYPDLDAPAARASREALLALMNEQGRACMIISGHGVPRYHNERASTLLPDGPAVGLFRNVMDWRRYLDAVGQVAARRQGPLPVQFALKRPGRDTPLIVHLVQIDPALCGPDHALLLINDPEAGLDRPITGVLHLLGLTPAEARIAATVGRGLPPREAAAVLGIAESTVRSTLKVVFDKLNLSRQTDLVALIARLVLG